MTQLEKFKKSFQISKNVLHFNNSGMAPLPVSARDTAKIWIDRFFSEGAACFNEAYAAAEKTRDELAAFLNAKRSQIAFFNSTAAAISQAALGQPLSPGDEVLVWDQEYPSNFYPWKVAADRAGAKLIVVPSGPNLETPASSMLERITSRTRMIAFSWVQYRSGAITDFQAITEETRSRGIFTCADVIQGAGALPFDFQNSGLDAICCGSHKWLAGMYGSGFICLRDEHIPRLSPLTIGTGTFGTWDDPSNVNAKMKTDITRFEPGAKDLINLLALRESVKLFRETGIRVIADEVERLANLFVTGLKDRGYQINSPHGEKHRGAIVNFGPGTKSKYKSVATIMDVFTKHNVGAAPRPPGIRLSPHAFNQTYEVEAVLALL